MTKEEFAAVFDWDLENNLEPKEIWTLVAQARLDLAAAIQRAEVAEKARDKAILGREIAEERDRQDEQWGGPVHDDKHDLGDWINPRWGIPRFVDRAAVAAGSARLKYELGDASGIRHRPEDDFEKAMIQIATLAIAAVQSSRRKR